MVSESLKKSALCPRPRLHHHKYLMSVRALGTQNIRSLKAGAMTRKMWRIIGTSEPKVIVVIAQKTHRFIITFILFVLCLRFAQYVSHCPLKSVISYSLFSFVNPVCFISTSNLWPCICLKHLSYHKTIIMIAGRVRCNIYIEKIT